MPYVGGNPVEGNNNQFSPVGGASSQTQYATIYDRPKFEMLDLISRHANFAGFATWLNLFGWSSGHDKVTTGHYEESYDDVLVKFGATITAASGAGADQTMDLHVDSLFDTSVTVSGVTGIKSTRLQKNDVIEFETGIQAFVVSKTWNAGTSTYRIVLRPVKAATTLVTGLANKSAFIIANYRAEGSGLPVGVAPRFFKYSNEFGIIKSAMSSTGSELTNTVYFNPKPNTPGIMEVYFTEKFLARHEADRSKVLLFGQPIDNVTELSASLGIDVKVKGPEGFIPFNLTAAPQLSYTSGSYTPTDLNSVATIQQDQRASNTNEIQAWVGQTYFFETEDSFSNVVITGGSAAVLFSNRLSSGRDVNEPGTTDAMQANARQGALNYGFKGISKGGYDFLFKQLDELNDVTGAGAVNFPYKKMAFFHPVGNINDAKTSKPMPIIGYQYKEYGGYSRDNVFGNFAGVGVAGAYPGAPQMASGELDMTTSGLLSEITFHAATGNRLLVHKPA